MKASSLIIISFILFILLIRLIFFYTHLPVHQAGERIQQQVILASEPRVRGRTQSFSVRLKDGTSVWVSAEKFPSFHYGQSVMLVGTLKENEEFLSMQYPEITLLEDQNSFLSFFDSVRQQSIAILNRRLNSVYAGLMAGIVLGAKQDMPEDFLEALQTAGAMHVIAASGMNVSMVAGALYFALQKWMDRRKAILISMFGVLGYVCLAGFEPSIVRAALMAGIVFLGSLLGRQKLSLYTLGFAAAMMLLVSPGLLTNVGFQLSVLATAGILLLQPLLVGITRGLKLLLLADVTTTLAAQLGTLPILLANFGQFNLLSVGINALILWTVPILMTIGGMGMLVGLIYEPLALPFLYLSLPFLWYFEAVVMLSHQFPLQVSLDTFPAAATIGYYLLLISGVWLHQKRKEKGGERKHNGNG